MTIITELRELMVQAHPVNLELSGKGFEVWSDDHPIYHKPYIWAEGSDDNMLLVMRTIRALPALLAVAEAAKAVMDLRGTIGYSEKTRAYDRMADALTGLEGGK